MVIIEAMSQHPSRETGSPSPVLLAAVRKILQPLVRLLIHHQITYPLLINLLKSTYVDVAETDFEVAGKRQSDSRINLLTGVHRKDVKRLRAEPENQWQTPENVSAGAQIIAHWLGNTEYINDDGSPKPLPLKPDAGNGPDFASLVSSVCRQNIRPRVVLDEWIRLGVAHIENERVVLNTGAFTPSEGFEEKAWFFGKNTHDHISAAGHNLQGKQPSHFDRSVYYDQLSAQSVEELRELVNEVGMAALKQFNREALAKQTRDAKAEHNPGYRVNFGIFNYSTGSDKNEQEES